MKTPKNTPPVVKPAKYYVVLSRMLIILGIIVVAVVAWMIFWSGGKNYAKEVAEPVEKALTSKGAVKLCSREDNGRGVDNQSPWYYGIYRISQPRQEATNMALTALKMNGFNSFKESSASATPNDINTFSDTDSKSSKYSDLKSGNENVVLEVLISSIYTEGNNQFCTIKKSDSVPQDETLIRITFGLPDYK